MKLAIISDIHDKLEHLAWARAQIVAKRAEQVICCGDFSTPKTLERVATWGLPFHFCLGNTDEAEASGFERLARQHAQLFYGGRLGHLQLPEGEVLFTHYPDQAMQAAQRGGPIAIFFGHSHRRYEERLEASEGRPACLLANPGDLQNRYGNGPSLLLWDSHSGQSEFVIHPA